MERDRVINAFGYMSGMLKKLNEDVESMEHADSCDISTVAVSLSRSQSSLRKAVDHLHDAMATLMEVAAEEMMEGRLKW